MERSKLTIFNQLMHNYIKNDGEIKFKKKNGVHRCGLFRGRKGVGMCPTIPRSVPHAQKMSSLNKKCEK